MPNVVRKPVLGGWRLQPILLLGLGGVLKFGMLNIQLLYFLESEQKGTDQTAWMHRLVFPFVVLMQQGEVFSRPGPYLNQRLKHVYRLQSGTENMQ